jgi:uncharacterized protein YjeT (DUF2065 family)
MPSAVPDWGYTIYYIGIAVVGIGVLVTWLIKK